MLQKITSTPINFKYTQTRLVSYYTIILGLLLLSIPSSCLNTNVTFLLSNYLRSLAINLGCFPLDYKSYNL